MGKGVEDDLIGGGFNWFKLVLLLMLGGGTSLSGFSLYQANTGTGQFVTHEELQAIRDLLQAENRHILSELDDLEREVQQIEGRLGPHPELARQVSTNASRIRANERRLDQAGIGE